MAHVVMISFSRGGLLALIITGMLAFVLIPKRPMHYLVFGLAVLLGLRMAGPQVIERFVTVFSGAEVRDASAQSRLDLWKDCLDVISQNPIMGVGPDHWPLIAESYGWVKGKEAHTLWLQLGAELGLPGLACLVSYYGLCVWRLWPLRNDASIDPALNDTARMVIASTTGFAIAAQFVSVEALELPYYVALIGLGALKMADCDS
jgi:O-antigen ligase